MNKNQRGFSVIEILIVFVVIFGVIVGLWFVAKNRDPYKYDSLTSGGHTFSFKFDKHAIATTTNGTNYLHGLNLAKNNELAVFIIPDNKRENCNVASSLEVVFYTVVNGQSFPTCSISNHTVFLTTLDLNNQWYGLTVLSKDLKTPVDNASAQTIVKSLKVKN